GGGYVQITGNSFAAPHLAGVAALIRAKHPELRPFHVKTVLWATAANVLEAPHAAGRLSQVQRPRPLSARATALFTRPADPDDRVGGASATGMEANASGPAHTPASPPPRATSSEWEPHSTNRPASRTKIRSYPTIVDKRCVIAPVVRPAATRPRVAT